MKKTIALLTAATVLISVCACAEDMKVYVAPSGLSEAENLVASKYSKAFYEDIEGEPRLSDGQVREILAKVPYNQYEPYPEQQLVPTSAVLYKDGQEAVIDVRDRRLIQLINFYNNALYYDLHAYTQGSYDMEDQAEFKSTPFRLELHYSPDVESGKAIFDPIIVTNRNFVRFMENSSPDGSPYSTLAFGQYPLYDDYPWLDLFGF